MHLQPFDNTIFMAAEFLAQHFDVHAVLKIGLELLVVGF